MISQICTRGFLRMGQTKGLGPELPLLSHNRSPPSALHGPGQPCLLALLPGAASLPQPQVRRFWAKETCPGTMLFHSLVSAEGITRGVCPCRCPSREAGTRRHSCLSAWPSPVPLLPPQRVSPAVAFLFWSLQLVVTKPKHSVPVEGVSQDTHTPRETTRGRRRRKGGQARALGVAAGSHWGPTAALQAALQCSPQVTVTDGRQSTEEATLGILGCLLKALSWSRNH